MDNMASLPPGTNMDAFLTWCCESTSVIDMIHHTNTMHQGMLRQEEDQMVSTYLDTIQSCVITCVNNARLANGGSGETVTYVFDRISKLLEEESQALLARVKELQKETEDNIRKDIEKKLYYHQ